MFTKKNKPPDLGTELKAGDKHYRAYVGPPKQYDLISAMVFNLLTCMGLRQNHKVLDVGCGSLRTGRLLIPYLNATNYIGVEPNKWLVTEGINNELGLDLIKIKQPIFSYQSNLTDFKNTLDVDFAFAQSVFSHTGLDLLENWLKEISFHLNETGILLATFIPGDDDCVKKGWIYPGCVKFKPSTLESLAEKSGLKFKTINWAHPRQTWAVFHKKNYNTQLLQNSDLSWNAMFESFKLKKGSKKQNHI